MKVEQRTMTTMRDETVTYRAYIDDRGKCRRAEFDPIRLCNTCKWCGKRPCGCKA